MFKKQPSDADNLSDLFAKNTIRKTGGKSKPSPLSLPEPIDGAPALKSLRRPPDAGGLRPLQVPFAPLEPDTEGKPTTHSIARLNRLYDLSPNADPRGEILAFRTDLRQQAKERAAQEAAADDAEASEPEELARQDAPRLQAVPPRTESPELQNRLRKTQLRLKAVQILLRVSTPLSERLKEIAGLMCESFSLWQVQLHLPVAHRPEQLEVLGSYTRSGSKAPRPTAESGRQLQKVFTQGKELIHRQSDSQHLLMALAHRSERLGVIEAVYSTAHNLSADEQLTFKSLCEEIAFYLAEEQKHDQARALSDDDTLTGLLNHRAFQQQMEAALKADAQLPMSLILLDLDFFRQINEVHGYLQGDQVLRQLATLLRQRLDGRAATLARFGGEEFAVLLLQTSLKQAAELAGELRQAIACEKISGKYNSSLGITASVGVAGLETLQPKARQQLLEQAFGALAQAKEKGRNQVQIYAPAAETAAEKPAASRIRPVVKTGVQPAAAAPTPPVAARKWSEILVGQQAELAREWARQTEDYAVPEVQDAVRQLEARLPRLIENLCSLLDARQRIEELEKMPLSYFMPSQVVAEIRRGQHQLISYEVAFMLLQESLMAVLGKHGDSLQAPIEHFFLCINEKLTALKSELQKGH